MAAPPKITLEEIMKWPPAKIEAVRRDAKRIAAERTLYEFVRQAWKSIDSSDFLDSWAVEALCIHLEQVTRGNIRFLLANYPPRCAKTLVASVCWPVWCWIQKERSVTSGSGVRFLCASYGNDLSLKNASLMRQLVLSPWFQSNWGADVQIKDDDNLKSDFANTKGGKRQSTSVTGRLLGFGGDVLIVDDPHNTEEVESDAARETVLRGWRELSSTRMNDPKRSALVVIMQRLHEEDVSGQIISGPTYGDAWTHLMIPMKHENTRHCVTYIGDEAFWEDPRIEDGELMWPERFGHPEVALLERSLGPYMASGRLQQSPKPSGAEIIPDTAWQIWPPRGREDAYTRTDAETGNEGFVYPDFKSIIVSVDTAYGEREENDWSACTVWGVFPFHRDLNRVNEPAVPCLMLITAWRARLPLHDLVQKVLRTCMKRGADAVLIEGKASGKSVIQEIKRLMRPGAFAVHEIRPDTDKVARAYAVQPVFADSMVYAPDMAWSQMVISECALFPKGKHDDLVDTVTQALTWLRKTGIAQTAAEAYDDDVHSRTLRPKRESVRDGYGV